MKANGLVFRGALAVPLLFASICYAQDVELVSIEQALATSSDLTSTFEDSSVETVAFHNHMRRGKNPFWFAGVDMLFAGVDADSGGRITASFNDNTTVGTEISFNTGTGLDDFAYAPRIVLGRQFNEDWGLAVRYFHLSDNLTRFPTLTPGTVPLPTFGTYTETNTANMDVLDLEAVRSFYRGKTKIDASLGARHAAYDAQSLFHAFGVITTGNFVNLNLSNGNDFDGTGIVGGLALRRQIGESPFQVFLSGRSSMLWGHTDSFGRSAGTVVSNPSTPLSGAATVSRNNAESTLDLNEFQFGGQFDFALRNVPAQAFFKVAVEYQFWDIDGPPTGGAGFGGTIGDLTTNSFASAGLGNAQVVGLVLGTGFTW